MTKYRLIRASLLFLAKKTASEASGKHGGEQSELNKEYGETAPTPVIALSLTSPPLDLLNKSDQLNLRTFAPKNFPRTDFFKTLTAGRK